SGTGITGMTERAQALGGTLVAGPTSAGGYRVLAELPLGPGARTSSAPCSGASRSGARASGAPWSGAP
ncbi:MAG TPA: hypothetical protein VLX31_09180, partial [Streptosporangiaceae bacterium]|nr:hypothetical protein [Streptosporangiaceae bacterium]